MRKMITSIAAFLAVSALMVGAATAADKLVVKGTDGTTTVFKATDDGKVQNTANFTTNLATSYLQESINAGTQRYVLRADGIPYWQLRSGTGEAGQIAYSTPAGGTGINFFTTNWTNRVDFANLGSVMYLTFNAFYGLPTLTVTATDKVGIGQLFPTQKLEVNGGLRLNPTAVTNTLVSPNVNTPAPTKPTCDANAKGTFWFTPGATDTIEICMQTAAGLGWKKLALDATTP